MKASPSRKALLIIFLLLFAARLAAQDGPALARFAQSIEAGQLAEVERDLFNYVIAHPQDAAGFALLAQLRLKQNRLNEAKALAHKALTLDEKLLAAKLTLADAHLQSGATEPARTLLNGLDGAEITDQALRLRLAQLYAAAGDCARALAAVAQLPPKLKNADALPFRAQCYLATQDKTGLASVLTAAKAQARPNPPVTVRVAQLLSQASLHQEAAGLLRLVIAANPKNGPALLLLAKSEIFLKDFAGAKGHLAQAERLQPAAPELLFVKALLAAEQGDNRQAFALLESALAANPNNSEMLEQFVIVAIRANYPSHAVRAAGKLLELQPDNLDYLYLFGAASLQSNKLAQAETALVKYLAARPTDERACVALGLTFAAQPDKLEAARQQMRQCLAQNPRYAEAAYQLGLSYKNSGELPQAVEYLEQTVRLAPNNASALRDLGAVYLQTGAETKARPVLEKAAALNPNDADTHFQLSRLYNLMGEAALAKKHLEIFQKLRNPKKEGM